ncbi:unnamed protein product [Ilex paraguariensis]|uniref:F-box associated beta-propeller type 3 domain-containing protein n=1 Tax=Ilex paraguariensis TaxID=185542 RepID=A0ABC8V469_9AQUA
MEVTFIPELYSISLNDDRNPTDDASFSTLTSSPGLLGINIFHSCKGLLCCATYNENKLDNDYHVYNPTTKQFITLPQPVEGVEGDVYGLCLAFDPSKSAHYKVVCVWTTPLSDYFQIEIYSSETGQWRISGEPFYTEDTLFGYGVYWNGSINWINIWEDSLYFNVDEERLGKIPMRKIRGNHYFDTPWRYFGESQDHLHLIEVCDPCNTHFSVYGMKKDYSEWFLNYSVDLDDLLTTFPEMTRCNPNSVSFDRYDFSILSLLRGEKDEESYLVLYIPGKAIRYNLVNGTFWKLCDIETMTGKQSLHHHGWPDVYEYIESLASV